MKQIEIKMLGEFSVKWGDKVISDSSSRSKKVWLMLACLVCSPGRPVPQKKIIELLWSEENESSNPENIVRITLHRLRSQLDKLWPGAGKELVLSRDSYIGWNWDYETAVDYVEFERLCNAQGDAAGLIQQRLGALELYCGDFLEKYSSELWVIPMNTHFHNMFVQLSLETAELLVEEGRFEEAARCCRRASEIEPYNERLVQLLMEVLYQSGESSGAAAAYETLRERLFNDFGIQPGKETQEIYRKTAQTVKDSVLPMEEVLEHLNEGEYVPGALRCDYDYFKVLCFAEIRAMERSGNASHIALISVSSADASPMSKRSLDRVMQQLGEQMRVNLRRGDTFSRCSSSQYIMMLPKANYENSCMVCRRCIGAFRRAHPRVAARINFMVQPLSPTINVP